jgi:multidrug efflux pump subunit AcrA (membrane-fusion protein)
MIFRGLKQILPLCLCLCLVWSGPAFAKKLDETLVFEGKVHYAVTWNVRNVHQGDMEDVVVQDSQAVKKGDVLGRYAISEYTRGNLQQQIATTVLQQKKMELDEARTKLRGLKRDHASLLQLYDEGMAPQADVEMSMNGIEQAMGMITFLEENVRHEEQRLDREKKKMSEDLGGISLRSGEIPRVVDIVSPIDGTVVWRIGEEKWRLAANTVCFKVADVADVVLKAKVFVEDYPKLAEGMVATVTAKGQPGKTFKAVLSTLPLTPIDKGFAALSYYLVEFEMDNSNRLLREGYRVTVKLSLQSIKAPPATSGQ